MAVTSTTAVKKIAVIIPFYNEEETLLLTLESFKNPTFLELTTFFLVNNNSTDKTELNVKMFLKTRPEFDVRFIVETNQGIPFARKKGLDSVDKTYDFIVSTDSDTIFSDEAQQELVASLTTSDWDVLVGKGTIPAEQTILRFIHFPEFVRLSRSLWKMEQRLFGDYFFGGYFAMKTAFYAKIKPYFNITTSPIIYQGGSEDLLLSRRAYYANGRFKNVEAPVLTSGRRFMGDPLQWILSERETDFRTDTNDIDETLLQYVSEHHQELVSRRINNTSKKWLKSMADALFFWKESDFHYQKPLTAFEKGVQELEISLPTSDTKRLLTDFESSQQLAHFLIETYTSAVDQKVHSLVTEKT